MSELPAPVVNPTASLTVDFAGYVASRRRQIDRHIVGGVPDYAFALDARLRRRLSSVPFLRNALAVLVRSLDPVMQQLHTLEAIAVGPCQFPEIHEMGEQCAHRLGIGIPRIFIVRDEEMNAFTYAGSDIHPTIAISSRLAGALDERELLAIIGHECGHIHNLHGVYNTAAVMSANGLARGIVSLALASGLIGAALVQQVAAVAAMALNLMLMRWSRCAEISCDRAGAICAGSAEPLMTALMKLKTGGEERLAGVNIDAYAQQLATINSTPVKYLELTSSHPLTQKRIEAVRLFGGSDVFFDWRPEPSPPETVLPWPDLERSCERLVQITGRP